MAATHYVSTSQVSEALGVSVTTVKRWVDEGILPAHKTPGGHRKLLLADVLRLVREGSFPRLDLSKLELASREDEPRERGPALHAAMRAGNADAVRGLIQGAYQAGTSISGIADRIIQPAMEQLGRDWEAGRIDVFHEHRGSQLVAGALYELKAAIEQQAAQQQPLAIGGCPENDFSVLPTLLAQIALLDAGWQAVNLGPHTPFDSFCRAIRELRPRLLWLSVSHPRGDRDNFLIGYRGLYELARREGVAVAVGGRALTEELRQQMSYTTFGDRLEHLVEFARTLHPQPSLPKRGRPPK